MHAAMKRTPKVPHSADAETRAPRHARVLSIALAWVLLSALSAEAADLQYVTDQYDFNLRSGESTRYKIIRALPSGTPLEILSVNEETGYARVRTEDGKTGYILTRYLQSEPAARSRLAEMTERLRQLQQAPDKLAARLGTLQNEHNDLTAEHSALQRLNEQLQQELAEVRHASANAVRINEERQRLQDEVTTLVQQVDALQHQNLELRNHRDQRWFMIGAAVVVGGIVIGLILPNLRLRRRRTSWGSL